MKSDAAGVAAGARRDRCRPRRWAAVCLALAASAAVAAGDPAKGRAKAASCAACHGENGLAAVPDAPNLAGQPVFYLAEQLRQYRSGKRAHEVMSVVAKQLSDDDIDSLAAWFASIEVSARPPR